MDDMKKIRVRFAPSPTGFVHIGSLRTALYDYLFAKKTGGDFILKIEDTDQKRYVEGSVQSLIKSLDWMGLKWNEGVFLQTEIADDQATVVSSKNYPDILEVGEFGPYIQSEKLEIYKKYVDQLVKDGKAYYCFCEPERLENMRADLIAEKKAPMYDRYCLHNINEEKINENLKNNCPYTIRMKMPEGETIEVDDLVRGKVSFKTELIDDQILMKSDGFPTYHLANMVDDHEMGITHVIRGEEWLPSLPKHLILYRYFGWEAPKFAHLPLLLNPDKTKLSKRQGDVAVEDYIKKGYLKEAIINFVALLGWNPGAGETQEIFSLDELVEKFELEKVHKAGAVFDLKKLDWINAQYLKKLSIDELYEKALPFFEQKNFFQSAGVEKKSAEFLKKVLTVERDRLAKLSDVGENNQFFFSDDLQYDKTLLRWKEMSNDELKKNLEKSKNILENISQDNWTKENLEKALLEAAGEKRGELLWPLRSALTGAQKSPSPFEVAWVLGKLESIKRIDAALSLI
jgi:glutamyl-tRNA synthetase